MTADPSSLFLGEIREQPAALGPARRECVRVRRPDVRDRSRFRILVPAAPQPLLSPLLSVVAGQLFAATLARAKGLDPDRPERLTKVTLAR